MAASVPGLAPTRVQIGTFNCNLQGASSASPDLTHWLVPTINEKSDAYNVDENIDGRTAPDLYAVGFQELLPLQDGFSNNDGAHSAIKRTDRAIRRAIRLQSATTRKDGKYPPGGGPEDYTLIATAHIVGIVLFVYARERVPEKGSFGAGINVHSSMVERIKEIRSNTVSTGFFNLLGNKGAAGVRVVVASAVPGLPDEVFTFVCAHLTAHDHNVPRRNADWKNIVSRLVFPPDSVLPLPPPPLPVTSGKQSNSNGDEKGLDGLTERYQKVTDGKKGKIQALDKIDHGVYETSHLFVFGDLNYRIGFNIKPSPLLARKGTESEMLKKKDVKRKINQADWKTLATYDQLVIEHGHSNGPKVFHGLVEPNVTTFGFPPTYKYKIDKEARKKAKAAEKEEDNELKVIQPIPMGSTGFGELSGKRVPGWTDRILWTSVNKNSSSKFHGIEPEIFRSIMKYTHSDHKPVTAILRVQHAQGKQLDKTLRPFKIDSNWRIKRNIGILMDRCVGIIWCSLISAGAGSLLIGISELFALAAITVWWLGVGGGQRGDLGYMLGNLFSRP